MIMRKNILAYILTVCAFLLKSQVSQLNNWRIFGNSISTNTAFIGTKTNTSLLFKTNDTQRLKIDSLGNSVFNGTLTANISGNPTYSISFNEWVGPGTYTNYGYGIQVGNNKLRVPGILYINDSNASLVQSGSNPFNIYGYYGNKVTSTSTVNPCLNVVGTMSVSGTTSLAASGGSVYLNGTTPVAGYALINTNGFLNYGNANIQGTLFAPIGQINTIYPQTTTNLKIETRNGAANDIIFSATGTTPTESFRLPTAGGFSATGNGTLTGNLYLPSTSTGSLNGIIYNNGNRNFHNFYANGTTGQNVFAGENSGNLTLAGSSTGSDGSYNAGFGYGSLQALTTGYFNTAIGHYSGTGITTGGFNVCLGRFTGFGLLGGSGNVLIGEQAGGGVSASNNVAIGQRTAYSLTTGNYNTNIGYLASYHNSIGSKNVSLGYYAGRYIYKQSDLLFIDSQDRTDSLGAVTKSMIYGKFGSTTATQSLNINAHLKVAETMSVSSTATVGGLTSPNLISKTGSDLSLYGAAANRGRIELLEGASGATSSANLYANGNVILTAYGNGNVGIGTTTPSTNAILELSSTTKGFLPTRMTEAQRAAISSPETGLTIYCTDCTANDATTGVMSTYNGSSWKNHW